MDNKSIKMFLVGLGAGVLVMTGFVGGALIERVKGLEMLDKWVGRGNGANITTEREVLDEESVVTKAVEKATPSVVTVSISKTQVQSNPFGSDFFDQFFGIQRPEGETVKQIEQDIGSGFIVSSDGLIVTNKHVVSDTQAKYRVVIGKDEVVEVQNIYRDPSNDLAILKINKSGLTALDLGNSDQLKVGQTVIAIGTALGEFRSTVTTGVISGLGRGIVAGSSMSGSEKLENVVQTDAAINPGNSGGPLLNSSGQVIGVNVAVSQQGQNIGFAIPINTVKDSLNIFKTTGEFNRPYLGVGYQMISRQTALLNDVPAGAYVQQIVTGSPAEKSGLKVGDIITEMDGTKLVDNQETSVVEMINKKKVGDEMKIKYWREGKNEEVGVRLEKREE
jgi:S1-C subfamily serine protease